MPDTTAPTNKESTLEEILFKMGLITSDQLSSVKFESINSGQSVEKILLQHSVVSLEKLTEAKAQLLNVPFIKLEGKAIQTEVLNLIPEAVARRYILMPFEKTKDVLSIAMSDPLDIQIIQFLEKKSGLRIKPFLGLSSDIQQTINDQYSQNLTAEVTSALKEVADIRPTGKISAGGAITTPQIIREAPVSNIINQLLDYAIKVKASDIHIEAQEDRTRVRYRIDGVLQEKIILPKGVHEALISRIKILSTLKIDEKRLPQDGRFTYSFGQDVIDLRVSTLPTVFGEKVVLRLLPKSAGAPTLLELGLNGVSLKRVETQLLRPHGIILVCGPTGSGKTTSLYALLSKISTTKVNILTVEDPVEYQIPGVNQVQINPAIGLTFASALRSFLRQDPNIIMVGEIRDGETAELAIQAALTGHQVFSTVHTNSAAGAPPRLVDMGVESFLLSSALNCVIGQRVVRKICNFCKVYFDPLPEVLEGISVVLGKYFSPSQKVQLFKGKGCNDCNHTGYTGRIGIYEVMVISEAIVKLILERATIQKLEETATSEGMITMKQDGYLKVLAGITTLEEVLRVAQD